MSKNVEPKGKAFDLGRKEWDALSDLEKTAVHRAIEAYANAPGTNERVAMIRAVQAYLGFLKGKQR